ncbi:hypothetical protein D3C76_1386360 [compost metagenome]
MLLGRTLLARQGRSEYRTGQYGFEQQPTADHFQHSSNGHSVAVQTVQLFRQAQVQPAELRILLPGVGAVPARQGQARCPFEHGILFCAVALQVVAQHADGFDVCTHKPNTTLARMLRWISEEPPKMVAARL